MHVGFCISCYGDDSHIFSAPISATPNEAREILNRRILISGEELNTSELEALRAYLINGTEIGWVDSLNYYLEGQNIPEADEEWV